MTDELKDLGRRAIACRGWKWLDGMLDGNIHEQRYSSDNQGFLELNDFDWSHKDAYPSSLPDFSDPATVGCLLALVREAWDDEWLACLGSYHRSGGQWTVKGGKSHGSGFFVWVASQAYPSEAEALIAALEAAP